MAAANPKQSPQRNGSPPCGLVADQPAAQLYYVCVIRYLVSPVRYAGGGEPGSLVGMPSGATRR